MRVKNSAIVLLLALCTALILMLALPLASPVLAATPIYVNGSTGNDAWDGQAAAWDGTHGPKMTIQAGLSAVDPGGVVNVASGDYSGSLTITNNVTLTLNGAVSINCTILTVNLGSTISADGKGYGSDTGTGKGAPSSWYDGGAGAGYGGVGGSSRDANGGTTYGSVTQPIDLGSGGGSGGGPGGYVYGGSGGGAIRLDVSGTLTINGTISASGGNGQIYLGYGGGGGSGGSIYITANTIAGSGTILASGGNGGAPAISNNGGGGGGGGRIAIYYTTSSFSGAISAYGGAPGGSAAQYGGAGTVFIKVNPPAPSTVTLSYTAGTHGTITAPATSPTTHDSGAVVTITASADPTYHFVNWTGDVGTVADVSLANTTITMNGDYAITANFAIDTYPPSPAHGVPVFPSLYVGIAAAFGAGILAYFVRRRLVNQKG